MINISLLLNSFFESSAKLLPLNSLQSKPTYDVDFHGVVLRQNGDFDGASPAFAFEYPLAVFRVGFAEKDLVVDAGLLRDGADYNLPHQRRHFRVQSTLVHATVYRREKATVVRWHYFTNQDSFHLIDNWNVN